MMVVVVMKVAMGVAEVVNLNYKHIQVHTLARQAASLTATLNPHHKDTILHRTGSRQPHKGTILHRTENHHPLRMVNHH